MDGAGEGREGSEHECGRGCGWKEREAHGWTRGARREARGCGRGWGRKREGSETGCMGVDGGCGCVDGAGEGRGRGARREVHGRSCGRKREGRCMGMDGAAKWNEAWRGPMLLHASRQNVVVRVERSCAADMLMTRTWLHHKHQCRLLRVSSQVERSMGGGSSAPCFAEARSDARGAVLQGLYDGLGCPKCAQRMRQTVKSWPKRQDCCMPEPQCLKFDGWNEAWRGLMLLHASC